jgi:hypothetical protein
MVQDPSGLLGRITDSQTDERNNLILTGEKPILDTFNA